MLDFLLNWADSPDVRVSPLGGKLPLIYLCITYVIHLGVCYEN